MARAVLPAIDTWVHCPQSAAGCGWKFRPARLRWREAPSVRCRSANITAARPGTPLGKRRSSLLTTPAPVAEPTLQVRAVGPIQAQGVEPIRQVPVVQAA